MIRNKGVTKSLRKQWKQLLKLPMQKKKRVRFQVTEISQREGEIAVGSVVNNLVTVRGILSEAPSHTAV